MAFTAAATLAKRIPPLFISHGGPNLYLVKDESYEFYRALGDTIRKEYPDLKAVVVVSAHWDVEGVVAVNTNPKPTQIYDFYGFPKEMYEFKYRPSGHTEVSKRVLELLSDAKIPVKADEEHGLDHGTWSPLSIVFPKADVPLIQVSLESGLDPKLHLRVGEALAPLQHENVLVVGSGSATHNLRDVFSHMDRTSGRDGAQKVAGYAVEFDDHLEEVVTKHQGSERTELLSKIYSHPRCRMAHPTTEHLAPMFVAAGAGLDNAGKTIHKRMMYGALSMACYSF